MPKVAFPLTTFQLPNGNPVANGSINVSLNTDGSVNNTQIQSNGDSISLNASGVVVGTPTFWPNVDIFPAGSYYILSVYTSSGQLVAGPNKITV